MSLVPQFQISEILKSEWISRAQRNSKYSLRAFARDLKIEPSALSKIIQGKRRPSQQVTHRLLNNLRLKTQSQLLITKTAKKGRPFKGHTLKEYSNFDIDNFDRISQWQNLTILELTRVQGFKSNAEWIAKRLNISVESAKMSVQRLLDLGLLGKGAHGKWIDRSEFVSTANFAGSTEAMRDLQRQWLKMTALAMVNLPYEERIISHITMVAHSNKIPQARKRIEKFRKELSEFLQSGTGPLDTVLTLGVNLVPSYNYEESPKQ